MYGPPPVVAVPVARRAGLASAPALAISCLLFILFLIAATIVLALIPIYLPRKDTQNSAPQYYVIISYNGTVGADGPLDARARANLARALENNYGLPTGSIVVVNLVATTTRNGKRKRRELALRRLRRGADGAGGTQYIVGEFSVLRRLVAALRQTEFSVQVGLDKSHDNAVISVTIKVVFKINDLIRQGLGFTGSGTDTTTTAAGGAGGGTTSTAAGGVAGGATTTAAGGAGGGATTTTAGGATTTAAGGAGGGAATTTAGGAGGGATTTAAGGAAGGATTTAAGGATTTAAGGAGGGATTTAAGGAGGGATSTAAGGAGGGATTTAAGGAGGGATSTAAGGATVGATTTTAGGATGGATSTAAGGATGGATGGFTSTATGATAVSTTVTTTPTTATVNPG